MLRAIFRRLTLAASLVVLLSISLSFGVPTHVAFAKTQIPAKTCSQSDSNCTRYYVAAHVTAPNGGTADTETEGAYGIVGQYHPKVGANDAASIAQIDIFDGTHYVEVGWASLQGSASSVIFVAIRDGQNLCVVQRQSSSSTGWTCGFTAFGAFNTTHYYPGSAVPSDGTPAALYLLNTGTDIYIQYGNDWLGRITNSIWLSGSFGPVTLADWQGETVVNTLTYLFTRTPMGDGICGTASGSDSFYGMQWFVGQVYYGSFQPVNAPQSSLTESNAKYYNYGQFNSSGINYFSFGGPGFHQPWCQ